MRYSLIIFRGGWCSEHVRLGVFESINSPIDTVEQFLSLIQFENKGYLDEFSFFNYKFYNILSQEFRILKFGLFNIPPAHYNYLMNNIEKTELHIHSIGNIAMDILSTEKIAEILGITSRGVFLKFDSNKMIFLSFENYRGPLTANLSGDFQHYKSLSPGGRVTLSQEAILFPNSKISISISNAKVWKPSRHIGSPHNSFDRISLIRSLSLDVYHPKKGEGLSEMLPALVGFSPEYANGDTQFQGVNKKFDEIRNQIAEGDLLTLTQTTQSFLGLGSGLTPSGDDFVIGLMLSLNRWKSILQPGNNLSKLNEIVVEAAYKRTTTLSANLIECAALGLADERLIQAVDYLALGKYNRDEVISGLLSWGNSSGVDALVGMITAFLPLDQS